MRPRVSVVVPFYNEEQSAKPLHAAIVTALEPLGLPFEIEDAASLELDAVAHQAAADNAGWA